MSNLNGTAVGISGQNVHLSVPFTKVDHERRMVHGFATLDNIDSQDDVVTYESSQKAFSRFRGNIREMHDTKAVGKMISFTPRTLFDPETNTEYNGIFVSTYVSKGAADTWEKVLDGTLTGFSIGGHIEKSKSVYDESRGRVVRIVDEYVITELSLVDNPANQLANVVSFEKGTESGYLSKTMPESVFYCNVDNVVQISSDQVAECHQCGKQMASIGFVESDDADRSKVVKSIIDNARNEPGTNDLVEFGEGFGRVESVIYKGQVTIPDSDEVYTADESNPFVIVNICTKNNDTIVETNHRLIKSLSLVTKMKEVEQVGNPVEETVATETVEETVEPAATEQEAVASEPVKEVAEPTVETETKVEESDFEKVSKQIAALTDQFAALAKSLESIPTLIKGVVDNATEATKSATEAQEVAKAAKSDLEKVESEKQELGERLARVETATAFRKSADVGDVVQTAPKVQSIWGGHFLDSATGNS